ncbi:MAG TPA: cytochrome c biogenesis protein [Kofleriaceae bacterium]|jgi:heme exporter protein C
MNRAIPVLTVIAAVLFGTTFYMAITYADFDAALFFSQKIFYWHVPHAFMLFIATGMCGVSSLFYLKTRNTKWDDRALAAAEVAVYFGAAVLATGMIWAKAAWDHWWVWENRLTMSLILWLVLVGYVIVRRYAGASGAQLSAGLAVFGTLGIPFVYFMVNRGDNHPMPGAKGNVATLTGSMRITFWLSVLTFLFWFLAFVAMRIQSARAEREVRELREKGLDAGILT